MPPDPRVLITQLHDPESRERAARTLEAGGDASIYQLLETLGDDDPDVRCRVVWALEAIGSSVAVPGLVNSLDDPDPTVRAAILYALKRIGGLLAMDGVRSALNDADANVRREAARALGEMGDVLGVAPLLSALSDDDTNVARTAAASLGQIGGAGASRGLVKALNDHRRDVKVAAIYAIGVLDDPSALRWIEPLTRHTDHKTQSAAKETAAKLAESLVGLPDHVKKQRAQKRFQSRVRTMTWGVIMAVPVLIVGLGIVSGLSRYSEDDEVRIEPTPNPTDVRDRDATNVAPGISEIVKDGVTIVPTQIAENGLTKEQSDDESPTSSSTPIESDQPFSDLGLTLNRIKVSDYNIADLRFVDETTIQVAGFSETNVTRWDIATGELIASIAVPTVNTVTAFSPDGTWLAAFGDDGLITTVDLRTGYQEQVQPMDEGAGEPIKIAAWSPSNTFLASASNGWLRVWNMNSNSYQEPIALNIYPTAMAWSPDGSKLAIADGIGAPDYMGKTTIYQTGNLSATTELITRGWYNNVLSWSPDSELLLNGYLDGWVSMGSPSNYDELTYTRCTACNQFNGIIWSPDGSKFALTSSTGAFAIRDMRLRHQTYQYDEEEIIITALAWSEDGQYVVLGDRNGYVWYIDLAAEFESAAPTP